MGIAFFDFDGTLTRKDTLLKFAAHTHGKMTLCKVLARHIPSFLLSMTGVKSKGKVKEKIFERLYGGMKADEFKALCLSFADEIDRIARKDMMKRLIRHQEEGDEVVIVTASISDWVRPWAARHGISRVIATEAETDVSTGRLTGRFSTKNCKGPEKVRRIRTEFKNIDSMETWGYGDSKTDLPMLSLTRHPRKV